MNADVGSCVGKPDYSSEMREEGEGLYGELKLTYRYTERERERDRSNAKKQYCIYVRRLHD